MSDTEAIGAGVGRYVVLQEAGRGAMGRVLRAYDPKLQREVALKEVRGRALGPEGAQRLVTEARAMAKLSHPNVVAVYDVEEIAEARVVVVMEYVDGQTLAAWLQAPRPWEEIVACFRAAGDGLAAAHAAGLLHRDFKPSNVLIAEPHVVKVTDFGLARLDTRETRSDPGPSSRDGDFPEPPTQGLTETGMVMGTPRYMAPEQHRGDLLTPAVDQYAFCVALWEALTGTPPFDVRRLVESKLAGPPAWPGGPTPRPVVDAIARGLSPEPTRRWRDMDTLLDALAYDPARRRRRWLQWGVAAIVLGTSSLGVRAWADARARRCAEASATAHLEGVWDDTQRNHVKDAILSVEASYAAAAWMRTEATLDDYASRWSQMHVDACEATHVRGEQSEAVMDLRMACLRRAKVELAATSKVLSRADPKTVQKVNELTSSLPPLARCADTEALKAELEPPLPGDADVVEALREHLAAAKAARVSGQLEQARLELDLAKTKLGTVDYEPVAIEVALEEGILLAHTGQYPDAEVVLRDVLLRASSSHRWTAMQDAAATLLTVVGYWQRRPVEAGSYADLALGLAGTDPEREARVHNNLGLVLQAEGRFAEAEAAYRRAVALKEDALGPDDPGIASSRGNLANMLDAQGKSAEAEAEHRRVLAIVEDVFGADHPRVAMSHNNLAAALNGQGKHAEAEIELRIALASKERALGTDHPELTTTLDNLASTLHLQGKHAEGEPVARRALALEQKAMGPDHPRTAASRHTLALIIDAQGRHAEAEAEHRRALELREKAFGPDHPDVAQSRNNLAGVLKTLGKHAEAEAEYRRALAIFETALGPDHLRVAACRHNLASTLLARGVVDEARKLAREAWRREQADDVPPTMRGSAAFVLAQITWASGDATERAEAVELAERALADFEAAGASEAAKADGVRAWLADRRRR